MLLILSPINTLYSHAVRSETSLFPMIIGETQKARPVIVGRSVHEKGFVFSVNSDEPVKLILEPIFAISKKTEKARIVAVLEQHKPKFHGNQSLASALFCVDPKRSSHCTVCGTAPFFGNQAPCPVYRWYGTFIKYSCHAYAPCRLGDPMSASSCLQQTQQ